MGMLIRGKMKIIKFLAGVATVFLFSFSINSAEANQAACNPIDVKPEALGSMAIVPDIVPVGNNVVARMVSDGGASRITISVPQQYFEILDYFPKSLTDGTAKAGDWAVESGKGLPVGNYDLTLKAKKFTAGKWMKINTTAEVWGGTSYGYQSFFIFYDTLPITISLGERNEVPQTTMDVVRKITLTSAPNVKLSLQTDKGMLGKTIDAKTAQTLELIADDKGESIAYLFAKEKDKIGFTATSTDSCQDSTITGKFSVKRSDVGRNIKTDYSWLWWLLAGFLIVSTFVVLIILWKRKKSDQNSIKSQIETPENIEPHQESVVSNNPTIDNSSIKKSENANQLETLESLTQDEKGTDQTPQKNK